MLSVLAAISENAHRIEKMFITDKVTREGLFAVWVYIHGEKQQVLIDNYFPCRNQKPVFSRAHGKELWVMILEKVWAKLHGSYEHIIEGQAYEVFKDFLGAPSYYHKTNESDIEEVLLNAHRNQYIMVATATPSYKDDKYFD